MIGNSTLKDSLKIPKVGGSVCIARFLGGLSPVEQFNPLTDLPTGISLSFFGSAFVLGTAEFPVNQIPFQSFVDKAISGDYIARPARTFKMDEIIEAHKLMESGYAGGKIVVSVS